MGVIEIFRGISKNFKVCRYPFHNWKVSSKQTVSEAPIIHFSYLRNLDEYADVGTRRIALFCSRNEILYFNSFGFEHVPEEVKEFVENKNKS